MERDKHIGQESGKCIKKWLRQVEWDKEMESRVG